MTQSFKQKVSNNVTEDQYAELAQLWHEYMLLGPRREDLGLDRTGRALMFCQWMDSDPDEDPAYGLPDILAFFDEKERREGTALPLEPMSEETRAARQETQEYQEDGWSDRLAAGLQKEAISMSTLIDGRAISPTQYIEIYAGDEIYLIDDTKCEKVKLDAKAATKLYDFLLLHMDRIHRAAQSNQEHHS